MENKPVFLRGKKTVLRPYDPEKDVKLFMKWINDPEVKQFVGTRPFPITETMERQQMEETTKSDSTVFCVVETFEGTTIGTVGIHRINWVNRTATVGAMIGDKKYWGKEYGTDAMGALLHYAFFQLDLRMIMASCIAFNTRSHRAILKVFTEVGRYPKWFYRNGRYYDEILHVVTKRDFMRAWRRLNRK